MNTSTSSQSAAPPARVAPRGALLAHAQASPAAVAAHDKRAWLALFADGGRVDDPVGTPTCAKGAHTLGREGGPDDLARFYDCFIAPNAIRFEVHRDVVTASAVARDVTIHVRGPTGVPTAVSAHLVYTMTGDPGAVRIARMEAFWQSADVMRMVRRAGVRGVAAMVLNGWQLAGHLGLSGSRAYLRGVQDRVRSSRARDVVRALTEAIDAGDHARAKAVCEPGCEVWLPEGVRSPLDRALAVDLEGCQLEVDKILACGWAATCSLRLRSPDRERAGIAVFELTRSSAKVRAIRLYWDVD
jgi:SnoaL-like domain